MPSWLQPSIFTSKKSWCCYVNRGLDLRVLYSNMVFIFFTKYKHIPEESSVLSPNTTWLVLKTREYIHTNPRGHSYGYFLMAIFKSFKVSAFGCRGEPRPSWTIKILALGLSSGNCPESLFLHKDEWVSIKSTPPLSSLLSQAIYSFVQGKIPHGDTSI